MDTINTFRNVVDDCSDKTKIIREHIDRYIPNFNETTGELESLTPVIDLYSEGFTPQLYGEELGLLKDDAPIIQVGI